MKIYFLDRSVRTLKDSTGVDIGAWPKLFDDIRTIDEQINVKHLYGYRMNDDGQSQEMLQRRAESMLSGMQRNDILMIPTPFVFYSVRFMQTIIDTVHNLIDGKIVFLTLDIVSFRIDQLDVDKKDSLRRRWAFNQQIEERFFNQADCIITQTKVEAQAIREVFNYHGKLVVQGPWAYVSEVRPPLKAKTDTVVFAGTPTISRYLSSLNQDPSIDYHIYGRVDKNSPLEDDEYDTSWIHDPSPNFHFHGSVEYSLVHHVIEGAYGLVWASTSYPTVTGGRGDYMRVSYSHKFSMYAVAGIPPIVWDQSCMAEIVKKYKIGWAISDLTELSPLIHSITDADYQQVQQNLSVFRELINDGFFEKQAILKMVGVLYNGDEYDYSDPYHMDFSWI